MKMWIGTVLMVVLLQQPDAETRVVSYLKANVRPGQQVEVSRLMNDVFKAPEEQQALQRLFNTFFQVPLAIVEFQARTGRIPRLQELSEQFNFKVTGEMDVLLRILESDPRVPKFLTRTATGEITRIDADAIRRDPQFGKVVERRIAGWEGRQAPNFAMVSLARQPVNSAQYQGQPQLLYFFYTNCPPCTLTTPILARMHEKYSSRGLRIIGANADKVMESSYSDMTLANYIRKQNIRFPVGHLTPVMQQAFGDVTLFPTLFFVNRQGRIVKYLVSLQSEATIEAAIQEALR